MRRSCCTGHIYRCTSSHLYTNKMASKVSSPMRFLVALRDLIEREKIDGTDNWEKIAQLMKSLGEKSTAADRDRQILEIYKISSVLLESCLTKYSNEDLQSRTTLQDAVLVIDTCILPNTKNLISCSDYQISEEIKYTLCMIHQFIATESMVSDYISDSFESHVSNIESGWLNLFKCNIVINLNNICIKMRDIVTKLSPCSQNQLPFFTMTLSSTAKKNGNYLLKKIDREGNVIRIEAFHPIFLGFTPAKKSMKEWQARSLRWLTKNWCVPSAWTVKREP